MSYRRRRHQSSLIEERTVGNCSQYRPMRGKLHNSKDRSLNKRINKYVIKSITYMVIWFKC